MKLFALLMFSLVTVFSLGNQGTTSVRLLDTTLKTIPCWYELGPLNPFSKLVRINQYKKCTMASQALKSMRTLSKTQVLDMLQLMLSSRGLTNGNRGSHTDIIDLDKLSLLVYYLYETPKNTLPELESAFKVKGDALVPRSSGKKVRVWSYPSFPESIISDLQIAVKDGVRRH